MLSNSALGALNPSRSEQFYASDSSKCGGEILGGLLDHLGDSNRKTTIALQDSLSTEHRETDDLICAGA